jgi:hypothetical protein
MLLTITVIAIQHIVFVFYWVLFVFQDGYKETAGKNGSKAKDIDPELRIGGLAFILLSVNLWAQVRSQSFSAKATEVLVALSEKYTTKDIFLPNYLRLFLT